MKKTIYIIAMVLSGLAALSCTERGMETQESGHGIVLTLSTTERVQPAVRSNGENAYNENLLNSFYYFFYPLGADEVTPALNGFVTGISETGSYSRTIPVSSHIVNNILFKNSRDCQLFVVANPTDDIRSELEGQPTLKELRAMTVYAALKNVPQDNFVMVYDGTIRATSFSSETVVNATVSLKRLACKFNIGAYVTQSIDDGNKIYTPSTEAGGLTVTLCNAVSHTALSGFSTDVVEAEDYFNSNEVGLTYRSLEQISEDNGTLYHHFISATPVYSYPMEWEFASETEPYLLYGLNWMIKDKDSGNTEYRTLYYKLTLGRRSITANEWYDISAKLTVLGSLYPDDPKEVFPFMTYQVLDWNQAFDESTPNTPAVITDTRFIAVPQTEWVVNNKDEVTIPFSSSHTCSYDNRTTATIPTAFIATKKNFGSGTPVDVSIVNDVELDLTVPNQVTVKHNLNNTLGAGMDMSPIEISFTLWHDDDHDFNQRIHITQYPAIYVNTEENSAGPGTGGQTGNGKLGTVYINGAQSTTNGDWRRIAGATSSGNNSSYFFTVITVSQFDPSTGYVVGDPRDPNVNNLNVSNWGTYPCVSAPAKYQGDGQTGNRQLKYYHPTIDDGSRDNFVSPQFRVNSAYCRSRQNNSYEDVKKRCASYQEDGYPAGRWRLPTLAECKLIQVLSGNGMVPNIFIQNGSSYYYAAGWWFTVSTAGVGNYNHSTGQEAAGRCVYDEWYWSQIDEEFGWDNSDKTTFTWGDIPTDYTHPASH